MLLLCLPIDKRLYTKPSSSWPWKPLVTRRNHDQQNLNQQMRILLWLPWQQSKFERAQSCSEKVVVILAELEWLSGLQCSCGANHNCKLWENILLGPPHGRCSDAHGNQLGACSVLQPCLMHTSYISFQHSCCPNLPENLADYIHGLCWKLFLS